MFSSIGKKLSDLERVTSLKVYNWFANRRKEIKRRANIGNVKVLWAGFKKIASRSSDKTTETVLYMRYLII